jgi:hypothetical protein
MYTPGIKNHIAKRAWTFLFLALLLLAFNSSPAQNLVANPDFESGTNDWFSFGPATFALNGGAHSGNACAFISMPGGALPGIGQSIFSRLQPGQTYTWSAWLRLSPTVPPPPRSVRLNLYYTLSGTNYTKPVATLTLTTTWAQAAAAFDFNVSGSVSNVMIGVDSAAPSSAFSFFLDDVSIVNSSPTLVTDQAGNLVTFSWPATYTGYALERRSALTSFTSWTAVTDLAQTNAGVISVTLSATNQSRFYRLKK